MFLSISIREPSSRFWTESIGRSIRMAILYSAALKAPSIWTTVSSPYHLETSVYSSYAPRLRQQMDEHRSRGTERRLDQSLMFLALPLRYKLSETASRLSQREIAQ